MNKGKILKVGLLAQIAVLVMGCSKENSLKEIGVTSLAVDLKTVTIRVTEYCPASRRTLKNYFVINESLKIRQDNIYMDWDRDGLDNLMDNSTDLDLDYRSYDTNEDGYSDMIISALGLDYQQQVQLRYCEDVTADFDGDGLTDCEERLLHTNEKNWDTDSDGVPDKLELRVGLNPLDERDAGQDTDSDGISNIEEIRVGTPISETNTVRTNSMAWAIELDSYEKDNQTCYNLIITNMPVLEVTNGNLVRISLIEEELPVSSGAQVQRLMTDYVVTVPRNTEDKTILNYLFSEIKN